MHTSFTTSIVMLTSTAISASSANEFLTPSAGYTGSLASIAPSPVLTILPLVPTAMPTLHVSEAATTARDRSNADPAGLRAADDFPKFTVETELPLHRPGLLSNGAPAAAGFAVRDSPQTLTTITLHHGYQPLSSQTLDLASIGSALEERASIQATHASVTRQSGFGGIARMSK